MSDEINYQNSPLHGVSLKNLLIEVVDHYGFEILFAYLNINCFKTNPSIESSVKFLKKTDWAREKVESFYLYNFKNLPRASAQQFELSPRDRIIPKGQTPGEPAELNLEDAERLRIKREKKAAERGQSIGHRSGADKLRVKSNVKKPDFDKKSGTQRSDSPYKTQDADSLPEKVHVASCPSKPVEEPVSDPWSKWKSKSE